MWSVLLLLYLECVFTVIFALFKVNAPKLKYQAQYGGAVQMECNFQVGDHFKIEDLTVFWEHTLNSYTESRDVLLVANGKMDISKQDVSYSGRTSLVMDELSKGRAILQITDVKLTDTGSYICILQLQGSDYKTINLEVQAPYTTIQTYSQMLYDGEKVSLTCQSLGFPKAEVFWHKDLINVSVPANTFYTLTKEGFYNITSTVNVSSDSIQRYECVFWNQALRQWTKGSFNNPGYEKPISRTYILTVVFTIVLCITALLSVLYLKRKTLFHYFQKKGHRGGQL